MQQNGDIRGVSKGSKGQPEPSLDADSSTHTVLLLLQQLLLLIVFFFIVHGDTRIQSATTQRRSFKSSTRDEKSMRN